MGQQVAKRDVAPGRAQLRLTRGVEPFQHLGGGKLRQHVADRPLELQFAALDELHGSRRGDRLRHGGDPEHRVGRHGSARRQRALAESALIDGTFPGGRHRDYAGDFSGIGCLAEHSIGL
jgi:hypothetical protein